MIVEMVWRKFPGIPGTRGEGLLGMLVGDVVVWEVDWSLMVCVLLMLEIGYFAVL